MMNKDIYHTKRAYKGLNPLYLSVIYLMAICLVSPGNLGAQEQTDHGLSFVVFTDQHIPMEGGADDISLLARDVTETIPEVDFGLGLGDAVHDKTRYIGDWKDKFYRYMNLPYYLSLGDHDIVDYRSYNNDVSPFPYRTLRRFLEEAEITTPSYAMMRSNILFLVIGDKGPIEKIHETQKEWIEYMVNRYPDKTTILASHAPLRGTTGGSNRSDWGWRHSEQWWWDLFHDNPQIKVFLNGDGHYASYVVDNNNDNEGYEGTNGAWGHKMAFIEPPSQGFFLRDDHNPNVLTHMKIDSEKLSTRSWIRESKQKGRWTDDFEHEWRIPGGTSYDESATDWYSFPVFLQDGEKQVMPNDVIPVGDVRLELIGMNSYSLFNNPDIEAGHVNNYESVSGFGNDQEGVQFYREGYMEIKAPKTLSYPDKTAHQNKEKGGKSGQIKNYLRHGTTPQVVPGARYQVAITARVKEGMGDVVVSMSGSDWASQTQYSTLVGSNQNIIDGEVGEAYRTLKGIYQAPDDERAWFLQGAIDFPDTNTYRVKSFSIKRVAEGEQTGIFHFTMGDQSYHHSGMLKEDQFQTFRVDPVSMTDNKGDLVFRARIGGNHVGMARVIYESPLLYGRNGRFGIEGYRGDTIDVRLFRNISRYSGLFKILPFDDDVEGFRISPGEVRTSPNGIQYGVSPIQGQKLLEIVYPGFRAKD